MNLGRGSLLFLIVLALVTISGCATMPPGPSVAVFPAPGKPFEVFQEDDSTCRQWANQQVGIAPGDAANQNLAAGGFFGTLFGAGLGAAIGAAYGNPAAGAAIGAASGLLSGTAIASGPAYAAGSEVQRRYDIAYQQCMYAKGNQVARASRPYRQYVLPPPPPY